MHTIIKQLFRQIITQKDWLFFLCIAAIMFLLYLYASTSSLDPDLGWHIRFGNLILQHGVTTTDPFSYTMPSYHFVNHEWFLDVIFAIIYSEKTNSFLALIFAAAALCAILLQLPKINYLWKAYLLFCTSFGLISFVGIRPQVLSWLLFSGILYLLWEKKRWHRWRWLVPFVFLIWANIHGGFPMGLAALGIMTILRMWEKRKYNQEDLVILFLSAAMTWLNPYGINLWKEIWISTSDASLRWTISEWLPTFAIANFIMWIYVATSAVLIFKYKSLLPFSQVILYGFFLITGLSSARNMPFWLIASIPVTTNAAYLFYKEAIATKGGRSRLLMLNRITFIALLLLLVIQKLLNQQTVTVIDQNMFYPTQAVTYLRTRPVYGNLFSIYGWGGYLIWKLPGKKVFVDGRMPSWKQIPPDNLQSANAYDEYRKVMDGTIPLEKIMAKYHITTILLPNKDLHKRDFSKTILSLFGIQDKKSDIYAQLQHAPWVVIYHDAVASIYQKKINNR